MSQIINCLRSQYIHNVLIFETLAVLDPFATKNVRNGLCRVFNVDTQVKTPVKVPIMDVEIVAWVASRKLV